MLPALVAVGSAVARFACCRAKQSDVVAVHTWHPEAAPKVLLWSDMDLICVQAGNAR